jgi:hypothetical protein
MLSGSGTLAMRLFAVAPDQVSDLPCPGTSLEDKVMRERRVVVIQKRAPRELTMFDFLVIGNHEGMQ